MSPQLDQIYRFGDVHDTLDACDELELMLGRLKRQRLIDENEWSLSKRGIAEIRSRLEGHLARAS